MKFSRPTCAIRILGASMLAFLRMMLLGVEGEVEANCPTGALAYG